MDARRRWPPISRFPQRWTDRAFVGSQVTDMKQKILILGLGNLLLRDEGLGVHALALLSERYDLPESVQCADAGVLGLQILSLLQGVTRLLVIDAVQAGQAPGTLVRLAGKEIPKTLSLKLSMHEIALSDILALSLLEESAPPQLVVWGMEPATIETGVGLSAVVTARLPGLIDAVIGELDGWGGYASLTLCVRSSHCRLGRPRSQHGPSPRLSVT